MLCVPHDPTLSGVAAKGAAAPEPLQRTIRQFAELRARLDAARPDVLVVVSGDHFNQWFYDNMPTFLIGKAERARGPFPHEQHLFGITPYDTALEGDVARHLLKQGFARGIDFEGGAGAQIPVLLIAGLLVVLLTGPGPVSLGALIGWDNGWQRRQPSGQKPNAVGIAS